MPRKGSEESGAPGDRGSDGTGEGSDVHAGNQSDSSAVESAAIEAEIRRHRLRFWRSATWLTELARKAVIWGAFFLLLWLLGDFFPLIFLTFVFAFVSSTVATLLSRPFPSVSWRWRVVCTFVAFLLVWVLVGWLLVPRVKAGAVKITEMMRGFQQRWSVEIEPELLQKSSWYRGLLNRLGGSTTSTSGSTDSPVPSGGALEGPRTSGDGDADASSQGLAAADGTDGGAPLGLLEVPAVKQALDRFTKWTVENSPRFITSTVALAAELFSLLFLATLFSFLIVLDLEGITREVRKLEATKLHEFYRETGASLLTFGKVLGKVLEAQAVIALVNTVLTAIGLWVLGIPHVAFLSLVVFICGFIPVAGVFISSGPICVVALYQGGLTKCALAVAFIVGIHFVEAYLLNPRIMGAALKVNPVLVLVILVIGHHALGFWGLLLGLPLAYYFFTHVIKHEEKPIGLWARMPRTR